MEEDPQQPIGHAPQITTRLLKVLEEKKIAPMKRIVGGWTEEIGPGVDVELSACYLRSTLVLEERCCDMTSFRWACFGARSWTSDWSPA
ncbi:unnamed protein product [Larinioides sclopetarius]|uniref:Uncharacterized protein n=1 Tax=Larinioides sclopetarius TaxID=280406 RepID=A0AAV2A0U8_9ARAC